MTTTRHILNCSIRAALLLSPAIAAVLTFGYLVQTQEVAMTKHVDVMNIASIER